MSKDRPDPSTARVRFGERLGEAGLSATRFIDVENGTKASHNHLLHGPKQEIGGNYGVYAGVGGDDVIDTGGFLIDIDIDDYDDDLDDDALEAVNDLPATFSVESPHTSGDDPGHRYYAMFDDPGEIVREVTGDDKDNLVMSWGEIRIKNQYTVGPGSQLDGCDKDWCDDCAEPDKGYYRIANDRPVSRITDEAFRELVEADQSADDDWDPFDDFDGSAPDDDNDDADHTGDAKAVAEAYPWIMQYIAFGDKDDRSEADFAVCREMAKHDVPKADAYELLNGSPHTKINDRGQGHWSETWKKAQRKEDSTSDPGGSGGEDTDADGDWTDVANRYAEQAADRNAATTLKDARAKAAAEAARTYEFITPDSKGTELNKRPLWIYESDDGCYEQRGKAHVTSELNGAVSKFSTADQDEVVNRLKRDTITSRDKLDAQDEDRLLINVENGVYDFENDELLNNAPEYNFRHVHPFEFDRDANAQPVLDFLDEVVEHDYEAQTLLEYIGYCFVDGYPDPHFLLLHGSGGNGKGIFFDLVEALLGRPNTSSVELDQMIGDDNYMLPELDGSFVNIDGDIGTSMIGTEELSIIKKLTGQDDITVQHKYQDPFDLQNRAKLMFAANKPPRFQDRTNALARRFMVIPFPYEFVNDPDPEQGQKQARPYRELMEELTSDEALAGLFNEAMAAYQGVLDRGYFTIEEQGSNEERLEAYRRDSDPIVAFAHRFIQNKQNFAVPKDVIYALYTAFAQAEGEYPADRGVFFRKLSQATPIDVHNGRPQLHTSNGKRRVNVCNHLWLQAPAVEYLSESDRDEIDLIMTNYHQGNAAYAEDFLGLTPDSSPEPEPKENGADDLDPTATQAVAFVVQNDPGIFFADLRSTLGMDHDLDPQTAQAAIEQAVKQGRVVEDGSEYRPV